MGKILGNEELSTKHEALIAVIIALFGVLGVVLMALKPTFGIFSTTAIVTFGCLLTVISVMFAPGLIYLILNNKKKQGKKDE